MKIHDLLLLLINKKVSIAKNLPGLDGDEKNHFDFRLEGENKALVESGDYKVG